MLRGWKTALVALAIITALVAYTRVAWGDFGDVSGSAHDLGSPGNPSCKQCHIPHNAQGAYLWATVPKKGMTGLQALCFSCHDGSVTDKGIFITDPNLQSHPIRPGIETDDCDRCHDPHEGDNWMFLSKRIPPAYRNANVCAFCHDMGVNSHPINVLTDLARDRVRDPYALPRPDFNGTPLWDADGTQTVPEGSGYIKCLTCHMAHGAIKGSGQLSMAYAEEETTRSPLCENCHK